MQTVFAQIRARVSKKGSVAWVSKTFGKEDVFTATWLVEAMIKQQAPIEVRKAVVRVIRTALERAIEDRFEKTLFREPNEAGPHPLPLLRALQAMDLIEKVPHLAEAGGDAGTLLTKGNRLSAGYWFERNLHRQMSFYPADFRFDAAEMIFCLAGALQTGATNEYDTVVMHVLGIVRDAQERSVYWRPYRPMLSTEMGQTLLPLSIEVATTLLHVLDRTDKFSTYKDTLNKYYLWLLSQRIVEDPKKPSSPDCWAGWHSENAYDWTRIHVWDTSRVAMFMLQYREALWKQVQTDLRQRSGFTIKESNKITKPLDGIVPYDFGAPNSLNDRIKRVIDRESFSLLLYGPPGVSKTTIAEAIAKEKGWELIYITPSDFISGGESAIEQKAKLMFDTLLKMAEVVVFFDEIDRLLLDRDSKRYGHQGDIFQFMTPSMLAKLAELRKVNKLGFIIATNYAERIDRAIKREGRIDTPFLCISPNKAARVKLIRSFIDEKAGKVGDLTWDAKAEALLEELAKATVCYVFEELRSMVRKSMENLPGAYTSLQILDMLLKGPVKRPEVTPDSFELRLKTPGYPQKPIDEYIALLMLMAEVNKITESEVIAVIKKFSSSHGLTSRQDLSSLAESCRLAQIANTLENDLSQETWKVPSIAT